MTAKQRIGLGAAVLVVIGVLVLAIAIMMFPTVESPASPGGRTSPAAAQPSPTPSAAPPFQARSNDRPKPRTDGGMPQMRVEFDGGIYVVNQDVAPGKYKSRVPSTDDPYWHDNLVGRCLWIFERDGVVVEWGVAQPGERLNFYIDPSYTVIVIHDCGHLELR